MHPTHPSNDHPPAVRFSEQDLPALPRDLPAIGFPPNARVTGLTLGRLGNELHLDLGALPAADPLALFPIINRLARQIDEDCRQMGHVAPLTVWITPPRDGDDAARKRWEQIDTDTDTNPGDFIIRVEPGSPAETDPASASSPPLADGFISASLNQAIAPRSENDYKAALSRAAQDSTLDPIHRQLLGAGLGRHWDTPANLNGFLADWTQDLVSRSRTSETNIGPLEPPAAT